MVICKDNKLIRRFDKEYLCIEPYGKDSLRVRATQLSAFQSDRLSALLPPPAEDAGAVQIEVNEAEDTGSIRNGKLTCKVLSTGKLVFLNQEGKELLSEYDKNRFRRRNFEQEPDSALEIAGREFRPHMGSDSYSLSVHFTAHDDEKIYGMGIYSQPYLNLKGCKLELSQRNSQVSVPFALSSRGYGLLWNNPAIGYVSFGRNLTEWFAESTKQMDYWVTAGDTPAELVEHYADLTGKVPMMPDYGTGLWQSKLRYRSQEEVLQVAREYKKRGIPISVIVIDFFHWTAQGDWKFDPALWPDPKKMVEELHSMGIEPMVSVWPTVEEKSENFRELEENGFLIRTEYGPRMGIKNKDTYIDATNPGTQQYVWKKLKKNYYDQGIHLFWLDECEPEISKYEYANYRLDAGAELEAGNLYPKEFARMVYEGRRAEGERDIVSLCRCAWAGSQRYGALVWTGDVASNFECLKTQMYSALNMGLAGMPWWTTDIGGFHGGRADDPVFRECLVRWFELATFCPVLRMHGFREPKVIAEQGKFFFAGDAAAWKYTSGSPNELWSYGEDVYGILKKYAMIRERLRPYIKELMKEAHEKGTPLMRPLFYEYPKDANAWAHEDEYLFGAQILVAPILNQGETQRLVYLPSGTWIRPDTREVFQGNQEITVSAPLEQIPIFTATKELAQCICPEEA